MKNKERYIARASNVAARMIGGEVMIMSGLDSSLFSLNATATVLWRLVRASTARRLVVGWVALPRQPDWRWSRRRTR